MKRLYILIIIFFLSGCNEQGAIPAKNHESSIQLKNTVQKQIHNRDGREKIRIWPFIKDVPSEQDEGVADNLLTKNYLLIFDGSGSMNEVECSGGKKKIDVAKESVVKWAKIVPENANLGLVAFHNNGWIFRPLIAGQKQDFIRKIHAVTAGDKTPLSDAFQYAFKDLTRQARRQLGYGEYTIVVVTDGIANNEKRLKILVDSILRNSSINIDSIGFCIGENHSLNQPGRTIYKAANNPAELQYGLEEVLAESETFDDSKFNDQ